MNRGLLIKSVREAGIVVLILATALTLVEVLLSYVLPTAVGDFSATLLQIPFIRTILQALVGMDVGDSITPDAIIALAWVHPAVLAIVWTQAVVLCTRVPAGEIDRGTIDVLFGLPVSRWCVYVTETIVFAGTGVVLLVMGFLGLRLGMLGQAAELRPGTGRLVSVAANMYCLYLAVGGLAFLVSAASDRRGKAMAIVFGLLLASFLLNFLAQFWAPAEAVAFLSLLTYYQPLPALRAGETGWPLADMAVLAGFAITLWAAGGVWFARRDICTV